MGFYVNKELGYYEGDKIDWRDIEVPRRPDYLHKWDGKTWVLDDERVKEEEQRLVEQKIEAEKQLILREQAIERLVVKGELVKGKEGELTVSDAEKLTDSEIEAK